MTSLWVPDSAFRDAEVVTRVTGRGDVELTSRRMAGPVERNGSMNSVPEGIVGVDGASMYDELMYGGPDVNPELTGRAKYDTYREMWVTDSAIRSALWMYELPARQATWKHEPAGPDGVDELIAAYFDWQFGLGDDVARLDLSWDGWLVQTMKFIRWGAMGEELVWGDIDLWSAPDGNDYLIRPLARMAPRSPTTITEIKVNAQTGMIDYVVQEPNDARIPGEKIQWYANDVEGSNRWGTSILRSMYLPYKSKKAVLTASVVGYDRFASGTPVIRYPQGASWQDKRKAELIGQTIRHHERGYVVLEGSPQSGWTVELLNGATSWIDPTDLLRQYDSMIATAALQQFSVLGTTQRGSRAVGEVLADPFYMAVMAMIRTIIEERRRHTYRRLVDVNFGPQYKVPKLKASKVQARNVATLTTAIQALSAAGLTFTDRDTQNDLRDQLDLRHLPELQAIVESADAAAGQQVGLDVAPTRVDPNAVPAEGGSVVAS